MSKLRKFVLCIEDDENDSVRIEKAISEINPELDVFISRNGIEAIELLNRQKQHLPCLILLDINMPRMNGRETIAAIKSIPDLKDIPIVIFTNSTSKLDKYFFERHGAEFISKPTQDEQLKKKIQQVVLGKCA